MANNPYGPDASDMVAQLPPQQYGGMPPQGYMHTNAMPQQPMYLPVAVYFPRKSVGLAFLLTFLFGPFGMLYSTVSGALIMLFLFAPLIVVIAFVSGLLFPGLFFLVLFVGSIAYWPCCIIGGCVGAASFNNQYGG